MINNSIIYKFFKDFTNHRKNTNRAVVFSRRPFPNILKYRDHQWDLPTIWKTRLYGTRLYGVKPKRVREWKKDLEKIKVTQARRQRLEGGGRNWNDEELEDDLVHWIYEKRNMLHVSRNMIMWKAKSIFDEKNDDPVTRDSFVGSQGWCQKFMRRYALSFRPQLLRPILHNR